MLIRKVNVSIWFHCMEKDGEGRRLACLKIKERQDAEGTCLSEPQKAHPTGEFVIIA